jgi:hypothetical protein
MIEFDFSGQDPAFQQALLSAGFTPFGGGPGGSQPFTPAFAAFAPQDVPSGAQSPFAGSVTSTEGRGGFGPDDAAQAAGISGMEAPPGMGFGTFAGNALSMMGPLGFASALGGIVARDIAGVPQSPKLGLRSAISNIAAVRDAPANIAAAGPGSLAAEQFANDVVAGTTGAQGGDANGNPGDGGAAEDFGFDPDDDHTDQTADPGDF